jgi:hypothetical protein
MTPNPTATPPAIFNAIFTPRFMGLTRIRRKRVHVHVHVHFRLHGEN